MWHVTCLRSVFCLVCPASSALSFLLFTHGSFKRRETIQNNSALASDSAMAVTDDDRREYLRSNVTSDLQYVWDDAEIPLALQYEMAQHYKSLRVFTALGESSADVRTAVQADFNLDPARDPALRAQVAQVVAAWNAGKELYTKEKEIQAESKVLGVPRHLQHSERLAMLKAVEKVLGHLSDHETPSAEYLALKVEECENGECTAASLDEVSSKADRNTSALQTSLDSTGHVRITKTKSKGRLPENTEEYRRLMKLEATTWLCMSSKFKSKHFLAGLKMEDFNRFVEFVLGEKVHGIKVPVDGQQQPLRPPFALVLQFEHRLRREAFKLVNKGEKTLAEALEAVTKDAELKESYFTTPLALTNHDPARHGGQRSFNNTYDSKKGKSKGFGKVRGKFDKGKGKASGKSKGKHGDHHLVTHSPDGREICFAFNSQGCPGRCGRLHICRIKGCYGEHAAREHDRCKDLPKGSSKTE